MSVSAVLLSLALGAAAPRASNGSPPPGTAGDEGRVRARPGRHRWWSCANEEGPCVRASAARALLLALGAAAGASAAGLAFVVGDRNRAGDPTSALFATGAVAWAGALLGSLAGRLGADAPGHADRVRPSTVGLDFAFGSLAPLGEVSPSVMALTLAPSYFFPHRGGRLRLIGAVGGTLRPEEHTDPRPQLQDLGQGGEGTAPTVLRERRTLIGLGLDLAVNLPYPVLRRGSRFLGRSELRYQPRVEIRREVAYRGGSGEQTLERTMLLPLTVGARWHVSERQRFTVYLGPRFDFVAFSETEGGALRRGPPMFGPLYAEAWFDLDIPTSPQTNSQASLGYVHSRFDGRGLNLGAAIGFFGPVHLRWVTRIRPPAWPVALQLGAGLTVGNGVTATSNFGVVLPDLGVARPSEEARR